MLLMCSTPGYIRSIAWFIDIRMSILIFRNLKTLSSTGVTSLLCLRVIINKILKTLSIYLHS